MENKILTKKDIQKQCKDGSCRFFGLFIAGLNYECYLWSVLVVKITNPNFESDYRKMANHKAYELCGNPVGFKYHSNKADDLVTRWYISVFPFQFENIEDNFEFINGD